MSNQITKNKTLPVEREGLDVKKKTVIFTSGPTGSGKSRLLNQIIKILFWNVLPDTYPKKFNDDDEKMTSIKEYLNFKSLLIDDYVENSEAYKEKIIKIINDFDCNNKESNNCDLENPSKELLKEFTDSYFEIREKGPCFDTEIIKSCKYYFNIDLQNAIKNKDNILIETTGKKIPLDYLNLIFANTNLNEYNFIFAYSITNLNNLIIRNKSRANKSMKTFIDSNYEGPAPRLPDISERNFKKITSGIEKTLVKMRNNCMRRKKPNKESCGDINNSANFILLIFDNNEETKLIYDSRKASDYGLTETQFISLLSKYELSYILSKSHNSKQSKEGGNSKLKTKKIKKYIKNNRKTYNKHNN